MKKMSVSIVLLAVILMLGTGCRSKPAITDPFGFGDIKDIFAGVAGVFVLREDNTLWGAGYNRSEQFGLASPGIASRVELSRINDETGAPFTGAKLVAAGENHAVILKEDGTLWGAGGSSFGELGLSEERLGVFTRLKASGSPIDGVKAVTAGNNSTFYLDRDNSLWASGYNYYGELGLGNRDMLNSFTKIDSAGQNVKAVAAGIRHTVILKENGTLWAAGYNFNGQLGLGDTGDRSTFTEVRGAGSDIAAVGAGNYHTVILKNDGTVWTAGSNFWGQLGFAGKNDRQSFTRVSDENGNPLTGVKEIAARGNITVLLKADGSLLLAGNYADSEGRIDLSSDAEPPASEEADQDSDKSSFVSLAVEDGNTRFGGVEKIILGYNSIYVVASDGRLWAAGSNRYGQLSLDLETEIVSALKLID